PYARHDASVRVRIDRIELRGRWRVGATDAGFRIAALTVALDQRHVGLERDAIVLRRAVTAGQHERRTGEFDRARVSRGVRHGRQTACPIAYVGRTLEARVARGCKAVLILMADLHREGHVVSMRGPYACLLARSREHRVEPVRLGRTAGGGGIELDLLETVRG